MQQTYYSLWIKNISMCRDISTYAMTNLLKAMIGTKLELASIAS